MGDVPVHYEGHDKCDHCTSTQMKEGTIQYPLQFTWLGSPSPQLKRCCDGGHGDRPQLDDPDFVWKGQAHQNGEKTAENVRCESETIHVFFLHFWLTWSHRVLDTDTVNSVENPSRGFGDVIFIFQFAVAPAENNLTEQNPE